MLWYRPVGRQHGCRKTGQLRRERGWLSGRWTFWRGGCERACDGDGCERACHGGGCERACGGGREGACSDWRALKPSGAIILKIPNNAADDGKPHRPESISNVLQRFELDLDRYSITMRAAHATGTDRSASPRDAC